MYYWEDFFGFIFALGFMVVIVFLMASAMDAEDTSEMCVTVNTKTQTATWLEEYTHSYFGVGIIWDKPDKVTYPNKGTAKYEGTKSLGFNQDVPDDAVDMMQDLIKDAPKGAPDVLSACSGV